MSQPIVGTEPAAEDVPRPPGLVRRWWAAHPLATDVWIAVAAGALALLGSVLQTAFSGVGSADHWSWWPLWLLTNGSLVLRRRLPVSVTALALGVVVVQSAAGDVAAPWALLVGVYTVSAYRGPLLGWCAAAAVLLVVVASSLAGIFVEGNSVLVVGVAVVVLVGTNVRSRRAYLAALIDRAARLEHEKAQEARLAASAERARIARELHDVVAHGMSVMISLADGADAVAELDPPRSREAMRQVGTVGRGSLADMRRLLGVLREEPADGGAGDASHASAPLDPQPGLAELDALVETYRAAGLPVAVRREGPAPTSGSVQLVLYRAVQESLTNALRHSVRPSRVLVVLTHDPAGTTLDVTDDGTGADASSAGSERGIVGLRERAALFGGTATAGPLEGGGWRVHVRVPDVSPVSSPGGEGRPAESRRDPGPAPGP